MKKKTIGNSLKAVNAKVLIGRKVSYVVGRKVKFVSPTTGRTKVGEIIMVGLERVRVKDRKGVVSEVLWEGVFEAA